MAEIRFAQTHRGLDQGLEYWLQVEGGATDDLQHVTCRGLILKRYLKILGTLPQFTQQTRILHRDDRLGREVPEQRDLLVAERPNGPTENADYTFEPALLSQRDIEQAAVPSALRQFLQLRGERIGTIH